MNAFKSTVIVSLFVFSSLLLSAQVERGENISSNTTQTHSAIIIIRPTNINGKAVNVYIDGEYVSSLLPYTYTKESVCPGKHRINVAYTNIKTRYKEKKAPGQSVVTKLGKEHIYRIVNSGTKLKVQPLTEQERVALFSNNPKEEHHTISRLNKRKCYQSSNKKKIRSSREE